jgi:hypothetical protein
MPTELCKKCGGNLEEHSFCLLCNKSIRFSCTECDWKSEQQIHFECWHKKSVNSPEKDYECTILLPEHLVSEMKKIQIMLSMKQNQEFSLSDVTSLVIKFGIDDEQLKPVDREFLKSYFSDKKHVLCTMLDRVLLTAEFFKRR